MSGHGRKERPVNTFITAIERGATRFGARVAMTDAANGATWTFNDVGAVAAGSATALEEMGIGPGERVAVLADGSPAYALTYLCVPAGGRVVVPLNTRYTRTELEAALADCRPSLLVTDRVLHELDGLAPNIASIDDIVVTMQQSAAALEEAPGRPREDDPAAISTPEARPTGQRASS